LVAGVFVFSIQDVIIKWLSGKYPVNEIVIIRSCIAVIPILFIAHMDGGLHLLRTKHYFAHIIRCFLMFCAYISFYLSMAALPLAETVSIFFNPYFYYYICGHSLG
jgi:S-adenosylmethionine uptake transporter